MKHGLQTIAIAASAAVFFLSFGYSNTATALNCTPDQKTLADAELMAIQGSTTRKAELLAKHMPHGVHAGSHASQSGPNNETLLLQGGYAMQHDSDLRTGLWVSYKLTKADMDEAVGKKRVNCFRKDPRLSADQTAVLSDFDEPIFDRGHLANDADLKDDLTEQLNSYVLSNMSAQHCRFNRGIWLSLEELGRGWAKEYKTIYITSGAVFDFNRRDARDKDESAARMGSRNQKGRVAIPSHYYKIFLRQEGSQWHSVAIILENNNAKNGTRWSNIEPLAKAAVVPIETIEKRTEVKFHPSLTRGSIRQSTNGENWDFSAGGKNLEGGCPS